MPWRWIHTLPLRWRSMFRRSQVERELDEELRFHLDARIQHEIAAGRTPAEARYAALLAMDGIECHKEECRDMRHLNFYDNLIRDVRYALRTLARNPGFTLAALLALALGIGANTAVFSVVNGVLLRPLPYRNPDRLVMVFNSFNREGAGRSGAAVADFLDWRARSRSFQTLDAFEFNRFTNGRFTLTGDAEPEQVIGLSVTATFFETLGIRPILGRTFAADEDQPMRAPAVVLSERLWRRRYSASPDVTGKTVLLNGRLHTIIGVVPEGFEFWQRDVEAWAILTLNPPARRGPFFLRGIARLKPGVSIEQASGEMNMIARQVERENPGDYKTGLRYPVAPLREMVVGDIRPLLWIFSGTVALVFLIAAANVANLMVARSAARQREIAIRLSIGASRGRLVRQFMTESVMLSLTGGGIGIALAYWGVQALRWLAPPGLPRLDEIGLDSRALAFTLLASIAAAVLSGLGPALLSSNGAPGEAMKQGGRGGDSRKRGRARATLVVAQVMLSVMLLIGAGLLIRSFDLLGHVDPGFRAPADHVVTMFLSPTGPRFDNNPGALAAYWDQLLERVQAVPSVQAASLSNSLPPDRWSFIDGYEIEKKPLPPGSAHPLVPVPAVSRDYFRTLGVPLLRGRWFDRRDTANSPGVAVISETLARRHFAGENPIGQRLKYGPRVLEIVGVAGDVKYRGLDGQDEAVFYQLSSQAQFWDMWLLVRTTGDAGAMATALRREVRTFDPGVPVDRVGTLAQALSGSVALPRFRSLLMGVFAATALLLAAIGIYGVIAYSVAQRTQEIGVRMALGATAPGVLKLVIGQGGRLASMGIMLGLVGAFALSRVLEKMLFGVTASDRVTFAGAAVLLGAVAFVASVIPALRAARVDPITALRQD